MPDRTDIPDELYQYFGKQPPTRPDNVIPITTHHHTNGDHGAYINKAHTAELADLAAAPTGGRNHALNITALKLARLPIDRDQLRRDLINACHSNGLIRDDGQPSVEATIRSAFNKADQDGPRNLPKPKTIINANVNEVDPEEITTNGLTLENLEQDFWQTRKNLQLIHHAALSRMAAPWAVLACCAARILCLIPPAATLPPIIGGPGTLNWFAAISAKSGGGKGAAMAVANRLIDAEITVRGIGSGEGMIEAYRRSAKDELDHIESVLFSIDEIDSLGAMGGRSGQTTMAIVRQGFSGEKLGYSYRGRQSETVPAHTYRMCIVASVQPERAGILFDDAGGGTPQRFMWFPGRDKRITHQPPDWPTDPRGHDRVIPLISRKDLHLGTVTVPDIVPQTIRQARAASMSGDDNALDSHALYCREKFAYSLAYLDGRTEIIEEDWRLSGIAASVSDWCRTKAQDGYLAGRMRQSRERGSLRAVENDERDIVEQQTYTTHIQKIVTRLVKILKEHGPMTRGALNRAIAHRDRPRLTPALASASEHGLIVETDGKWALA